ncbi:TIGR01906 family membrane protein [Enterococcus alishanensis]|uniref:TIGR01906 family membrane protein n=1 Tax=Enterococcus alishanensis TaxID=1303817 RepID=A0ABS6THC0_9ENTE|nr:TIGR01906 family membrane protein [Enterococcus alishanensis]MBV7392301.1 TIGR01906 family membrane protein [Enterococcus alishanensis]
MSGHLNSWKWLERLGLICWIFTLLTLAITLTINARWLYSFSVDHLNVLDYVTFSKNQLMKNFDQLMHYLNLPWVDQLKMSDFPVSESGAVHFVDVKKLFLLNYGVLIVTIIPSIFYLRHLVKTKRLWTMQRPFKIAFVIPLVIAAVGALNFNQFFVLFHETFFSNDDWIFNPVTDPIINVLPEDFFMYCFILFFVLLEVFFLVQIFIGKRSLKRDVL